MSMCITVAAIERKPKRSAIVTTEGRRHFCWTNKLDDLGIEPGGTYNVTIEEFQGKDGPLPNIASAKRVTLGAATSQPAAASSTPQSASGYYRPTSPEDSERMFVCSLMNAFIQAGKIEPEQNRVIKAINVLREAYHATFGDDGAHFRQAAE